MRLDAHAPPPLLLLLVENQHHIVVLNMYYSVSTTRCVFAMSVLMGKFLKHCQGKLRGKDCFHSCGWGLSYLLGTSSPPPALHCLCMSSRHLLYPHHLNLVTISSPPPLHFLFTSSSPLPDVDWPTGRSRSVTGGWPVRIPNSRQKIWWTGSSCAALSYIPRGALEQGT